MTVITISEVGHNQNAPDRFLMVGDRRLALFKTRRFGRTYSYEIYRLNGGEPVAKSTDFEASLHLAHALYAAGKLKPEVLAGDSWWRQPAQLIVAWFAGLWRALQPFRAASAARWRKAWCWTFHRGAKTVWPLGAHQVRCRCAVCGREWIRHG